MQTFKPSLLSLFFVGFVQMNCAANKMDEMFLQWLAVRHPGALATLKKEHRMHLGKFCASPDEFIAIESAGKPVLKPSQDIVVVLKNRLLRKLESLEKRVDAFSKKAAAFSNGVDLFPGCSVALKEVRVIVKTVRSGDLTELKAYCAQNMQLEPEDLQQVDAMLHSVIAVIAKGGVDAALMVLEMWITSVIDPMFAIAEAAYVREKATTA